VCYFGILARQAEVQPQPQCRHLRLLYATSRVSLYEARMIARNFRSQPLLRAAVALTLLVPGFGLAGCAYMGDTAMVSAFADPAKYEFFTCKQLEDERKSLASRGAELQGLMAKADTGVAGPVVAELAYRNDYISVRAQSRLAEEAWRRNKCHDSPPPAPGAAPVPAPPPPAATKGKHSHAHSGDAAY
jgi:hypothetical protein